MKNTQFSKKSPLKVIKKPFDLGPLADLDVSYFSSFYEKCLALPLQKKFLKKGTVMYTVISTRKKKGLSNFHSNNRCLLFLW